MGRPLENGNAASSYPYPVVPFGGALAELYRRYGRGFFQNLANELSNGAYPVASTARAHACNLVQAAEAVTSGDAHDLLVGAWRLPHDCGLSPLSAQLDVYTSWDTGYCANVQVTNRGATTTPSWTVVIDLHQSRLQNGWNAAISTSGSWLTAGSLFWNATLAPGASATFGFCATRTGTDWTPTVVSADP